MIEFLQANSLFVILGAGVAILVTLLLMAIGSADERRLQKRLSQVAATGGLPVTGSGKKTDPSLPTLKAAANQRRASKAAQGGGIGSILPNIDLLTLRLERAGLNISVSTMLIIAACLSLFALLLFAVMLKIPLVLALLAAIAIGIALPSYFVSSAGKKRAKRFLKDLPDAIDLIVRSVKSGLPVSEAIFAISRDLKGPAAVEFTKISDQMRIGIPLDEAFARSVKRIGISDFAFLAISLSITQETGGNLGETLTNLSRLLRLRQQMHLKIHALTSEARASAMIVGSLPFLVVGALTVLNPDYINVLFTDPTGHKVLYFAGGSLGIGFFVMSKIVKFDF
ncbi:type II secretion system F family protein [Emcibacter sp. SYSU 3D8]|uniref:type II secretion system F family protein n=1 Tax=Emcibacter sp. SYSU 3D8 TaxID=3133969 RepID=UPI0031FEBE22